jgi:hypothetical protein
MGQRFCLFFAGYCVQAPSGYFRQLHMVHEHNGSESETVRKRMQELAASISEDHFEHESHIRTARSIADHFEIPILPDPDNATGYFEWLKHYVEAFERQFPMNRIDHYYFFYARKLSEISNNSKLARQYLNLSQDLNGEVDFNQKIDNCLKDNEYALFKMIAAAALLSSEPRQNYFNSSYKELNQQYDRFRRLDVNRLDAERRKELVSDLTAYAYSVENNYRKCAALLKELGV